MQLFFKLVREILWQPFWWVVSFLFMLFGNVLSLVDIVKWTNKEQLLEYVGDTQLKSLLMFMSAYWLPLLIIMWLGAVSFGIFKRSRKYLGDRIIADKITLSPKDDKYKKDGEEKYVWIQVDNKEGFDCRECFAKLTTLKIKEGENWISLDDIANANYSDLTFPEFQDKEVIIHAGHRARVNIAKTPNGNTIFLIFQRGDKSIPQVGQGIYIEVALGCTDYGNNGERRKIEDRIFKGFLVLEVKEYSPSMIINRTEIKGKRTIKTEELVVGDPLQEYHLYLRPGELDEK